jgi:hypothetical protein
MAEACLPKNPLQISKEIKKIIRRLKALLRVK